MIKKIEFIATGDTLINVELENEKTSIKFSDIYPYWDYATEEDFEGGFAKIIEDKILFTMHTASMQGGIIGLWNAKTQKIEHISDGSYCVSADFVNEKIYSLLCISNFETPASFSLWQIPVGVMDAFAESEKIDVELPGLIEEFNGDIGSVELEVQEDGYSIKINDKVMFFSN